MASKAEFGPTGDFPEGSLGPTDRGGLRIGVAHDSRGNVILNFGTEVSWIGFPPAQAIELAISILKHAGIRPPQIWFEEEGIEKP